MSDDRNILKAVFDYEPSTPAAIVTAVIFAIVGLGLSFHIFRRRDLWGLWLLTGVIVYMTGFILRPAVKNSPTSLGLFIGMQLCLLLPPSAFLAFNYTVYGRFVKNRVGNGYSLIRPTIVTSVFVTSDVITFLVQGGGGGLQSSDNTNTSKLGADIILAGLILQLISYLFFTTLVISVHRKINKNAHPIRNEEAWRTTWLLYFSSVFILIRNVYRVVEFAEGRLGYLITHEIYLYLLDALPLLLAIGIYIPFWPGKYVDEREELPKGIPLMDVEGQRQRTGVNYTSMPRSTDY